MRILNKDNDQAIKNILIMLTPEEAKELAGKITDLTTEPGDHSHINDEIYSREITLAIYTPENLHSFNKRVIELVEKEV